MAKTKLKLVKGKEIEVDLIDGLRIYKRYPECSVIAGQLGDELDLEINGEMRHGEVGDWLIVGGGEGPRICRAGTFAASYRETPTHAQG